MLSFWILICYPINLGLFLTWVKRKIWPSWKAEGWVCCLWMYSYSQFPFSWSINPLFFVEKRNCIVCSFSFVSIGLLLQSSYGWTRYVFWDFNNTLLCWSLYMRTCLKEPKKRRRKRPKGVNVLLMSSQDCSSHSRYCWNCWWHVSPFQTDCFL